jgi:Holliday junction resolvase RusA-like endonuclease
MALTEEASRFRENVKAEVVRQLAQVARLPVGQEVVYRITLHAYFDQLENPGWFKTLTKGPRKGERDAKSRYKALDIDNRIKFLQDCVVRSVGIPNDSQVFESHQIKLEDPDKPRAEVLIEVRPWSDYFPKGGRYGPQTTGR